MELYCSTVESQAEHEFETNRAAIRDKNADLADYLDTHWCKYKTKLVACWTSQYLHFGYRDTSAVEGTHSKCKTWLESSRGDLYKAFKKPLPWWNSSICKISFGASMDIKNVPHALQDERFSAVAMFVGRYALLETVDLWKKAHKLVSKQEVVEPCTGVFRRTNGRPCVHELVEIVKSERQMKLLLEHFTSIGIHKEGEIARANVEFSNLLRFERPRSQGTAKQRHTRKTVASLALLETLPLRSVLT
ncbi:hypothetical protein ON010_g13455 [Phytophthora cinnamomi]|nr:hypothetical protein ON010_g13455 [Phytophthora cinnamomi]